jgi:hypothetical protein
MAAWYEPAGQLKLSAITSQYVRILTGGLVADRLPGVAQAGSFVFKSSAQLQG